ncbi:MAG TPA: M48 family metallopeptidase [Patescibacteria group bacterium]|nr:M48 family metallopeptidase [Patescibacteria group bacterium]
MADKLIYKHEKKLFWILFVVSTIAWVALTAVTFGAILLLIPVGFILYLFAQSALISHLRGNGALIAADQFPDLNERVQACAKKLDMNKVPAAYIMNGNGVLNAFATQFLRRHYIVLLSSVVDALQENPDAINFYIGHELGHIKRHHVSWSTYLVPGSILPIAGAAYSRSREYTCDKHGATCCESPQSAQQALAALAVGTRRWQEINLKNYVGQVKETSGFWMSFHELLRSYPWLTKRVARVSPDFPQDKMPRRNPFAVFLCLFIPRLSLITLLFIYGLMIGGGLKAQELIAHAKERQHQAAMGMYAQPGAQAQLPVLPSMPPASADDDSGGDERPAMPDAPPQPGN